MLNRFCVTAVAFLVLTAAQIEAATPPDGTVPSSLGMQTKPDSGSFEDLKKMHDVGVRFVRRGVYWNKVEPQKGQYDFQDFDRFQGDAEKLGMGVVACLFGNNKLHEDDPEGGIQSEAGRKGFAAFAAQAAARYKGRQVLWEIWNEPNVATFWRKTGIGKHNSDEFAAEYTALVKEVVPAMLKADPDCYVMAGSLSNYWDRSYEWTEFCFKRGILETGIRAWSVHPYGTKTPEEHAIGHAKMRELLAKYGKPELAILNTERGFAVKKTEEGWSGGSEEKALEYESWHFVRQYMIDCMYKVPLTIWYEWKGEKFGFIHDGKARPVDKAARTMLAQLDGYRFSERIKTDSDLDYLLIFANKHGHRKMVAWTAPPPKEAPDAAKPHAMSVEVGQVQQVSAVDIYGQLSNLQVTGGRATVNLSGSPQYITLPPLAR
jgi:polysaccharide biosynthesis protein PslG